MPQALNPGATVWNKRQKQFIHLPALSFPHCVDLSRELSNDDGDVNENFQRDW